MRATQGERRLTGMVTTPFVLNALRSKAYRSMNGMATAVFRFNEHAGLERNRALLENARLSACRNGLR
jgi:hypothetical protein